MCINVSDEKYSSQNDIGHFRANSTDNPRIEHDILKHPNNKISRHLPQQQNIQTPPCFSCVLLNSGFLRISSERTRHDQ